MTDSRLIEPEPRPRWGLAVVALLAAVALVALLWAAREDPPAWRGHAEWWSR